MRVCFLVDYRGKLTREVYFTTGTVAEFDDVTAGTLIDEGRAVQVAAPQPEITPALPRPRKRQTAGGVL